MTVLSRRALLARGAGGLALSQLPFPRSFAASLPLANAVEFVQGNASKLSSILYADTKAILNAALSPITTQNIFMTVSVQFTKFMTATYPGQMTLVSITDVLGHPRFVVNMLPPSVMIPGSSGNNPSLQIMGAVDSAVSNYFSYVIPNFSLQNGNESDWHTFQIKIGILPTMPPRWIIEAVDFNNNNAKLRAGPGFWTNPTGTIPNHSQVAPPAFPIPLQNSGFANDPHGLVLSVGGRITSGGAGYKPIGGSASFYDALAAKVQQMFLHFMPGDVDLTKTLPHFLNLNNAPGINKLTTAISQAQMKVSNAYEVANAAYQGAQYSTIVAATQAAADAYNDITAALSEANTIATAVDVKMNIIYAQQYANSAKINANAALTEIEINNNVAAAVSNILSAMNDLVTSEDSLQASLNSAYPPVPTSVPVATVPVSSSPALFQSGQLPSLVMDGNATTGTNISTGDTVPASSNSFSYNQVNGVDGSLTSGPGQAPVQSPDDGSGVTIESITINGM